MQINAHQNRQQMLLVGTRQERGQILIEAEPTRALMQMLTEPLQILTFLEKTLIQSQPKIPNIFNDQLHQPDITDEI